ncbi:hypothetical protein ACLBYD_30550 [Rhodococcus sp. C26F]
MSNTNLTRTTVAVLEPGDTPIFDELTEHFFTTPVGTAYIFTTPAFDELDRHFHTIPIDIALAPDTIDAQIVDVRDVPAHDTNADEPPTASKASKAEVVLWSTALGATAGTIVWLNNLLNATAIA